MNQNTALSRHAEAPLDELGAYRTAWDALADVRISIELARRIQSRILGR